MLDHYLEVLTRKPGALPGSTALAQARAAGVVHPDARGVLGRGPGKARRRRRHPGPDRGAAAAPAAARGAVQAGLTAALTVGACTPTWSRSRPASTPATAAAAAPETDLLAEDQPVISLTERRLTAAPGAAGGHPGLPSRGRLRPAAVEQPEVA